MSTSSVLTDFTPLESIQVNAPRIHIYPFSRLINAPAARWEKLIAQLEEKEKIIFLYYQPVREAIVKLAAEGLQNRDDIYEEMSRKAADVIASPSQNPVADNQKCFACFEEKFLPKIATFTRSLLKIPQVQGTFFYGVILRGMPHMEVIDRRGRTRYVHLYPSSWKDHELDAYMELLTVVIESEFGGDAKDLWCMDLKQGKTIPRIVSKVRTRQACRDAAKLYRRMVDASVIKAAKS